MAQMETKRNDCPSACVYFAVYLFQFTSISYHSVFLYTMHESTDQICKFWMNSPINRKLQISILDGWSFIFVFFSLIFAPLSQYQFQYFIAIRNKLKLWINQKASRIGFPKSMKNCKNLQGLSKMTVCSTHRQKMLCRSFMKKILHRTPSIILI